MSTVPTPTTGLTDLSPFHLTIAATWNDSGLSGTSGVVNTTFGATARLTKIGNAGLSTVSARIMDTGNITDTHDRVVILIPSSTVQWRLADSSGATGILLGGSTFPVVLPVASSVWTPSLWGYTVTAASTMTIGRVVI